jgi:mRNA interferase MazF
MVKDFLVWNTKKIRLDTIEKRPFFHVREIWFCYLGANVVFEQDGRGEDFLRPVVIVKKFNNEVFWGVPLIKTIKLDRPYLYQFSFIDGIKSTAVLSQMRLIDARRLSYVNGEMDENDYVQLTKKLKALLP